MNATIDSIIATLSTIRIDLFIGAVALFAASVVLAGLRWRTVLNAMGFRPTLLDTILVYLAGMFVNNTTPASRMGGEACRIILIRKRAGAGSLAASVSILYDRLSEIIPIAIFFVVALPSAHAIFMSADSWLRLLIAGSIIAVAIILLSLPAVRARLKNLSARVAQYRLNVRALVQACGYSTLIWLQDAARFMLIAMAFGTHLTLSQAAAISIAALFAGFVPTIGGLGAIEGGVITLLYLFGVNLEAAIAITAAERMISYLLCTGAGGIALATIGRKGIWTAIRSRSSATGTCLASEE